MSNNYINYRGILVPFYNLEYGGVDNAIRMGIYPIEEDKLLNLLYKPRDVVYDIGAYIGSHSILFALNGAEVFSFEPSPFNFPRLKENCKHFRQISCFNVALHDKKYNIKTQFKDCNDSDGVNKEQDIEYVILEEYIKENKIPYPNFIKMDIEGMESLVLKTMSNIFQLIRPILSVELHKKPIINKIQDYEHNPHWRNIEDGGFDFNLLKSFDYRFYWADSHNIIRKENNLDWNHEIGPAVILIPKESNIELPLKY